MADSASSQVSLPSHYEIGGLRPGTTKGRVEEITTANINYGRSKPHPTINDYYQGCTKSKARPLSYQHGLSNFSSVRLGDERISYTKSLSQEVYKMQADAQHKIKVDSLQYKSREKTEKQRRLDYLEAQELVGDEKIEAMEVEMRDKLNQRTSTGPFQLRKTFKYFDRDGSGGIDLAEFTDSMELMGFQFTELQILALFARYDVSYTGEVDYHEFVDKLMEWDYGSGHMGAHGNKLNKMVSRVFGSGAKQSFDDEYDSDMDQEELEHFRNLEIKKIFDMIDKDKSGFIDAGELEILMLALGRKPTPEVIEDGISKIDLNGN
mmetsp:Transcript_107825/g.313830  ORF Transcript_107825/g.313830 Transcript_107825/m.313830 type:complete len:321 (+) Transcript_107825:222-1184(+)